MKKSISFFSLLALWITLFVLGYSCKLKTIEPNGSDVGYDYYPLEVGRYIIYDAYDTILNSTQTIDTMYHVKERIETSFTEGDEVKFLVYRFNKKVTDTDWSAQPDSVWTVVNTANQLVRTESNIDYIKLVFPVKEGMTWNGDAKNTMGENESSDQFYKMTNVDRPYQIYTTTYPKTLIMTIANQADPIVSKDVRYDVYGKGIGFIKKDYTVYYYKQDNNSPPQTIDYGFRKILLMTSYGKEATTYD